MLNIMTVVMAVLEGVLSYHHKDKSFKLVTDEKNYWYDLNEYFWRSATHYHIRQDESDPDPLFFGLKAIHRIGLGTPLHPDKIPAFVKAVYLSTWT